VLRLCWSAADTKTPLCATIGKAVFLFATLSGI